MGVSAGCRGREDQGASLVYLLRWLWTGDGNKEGLRKEHPAGWKETLETTEERFSKGSVRAPCGMLPRDRS